MTNYALVFPGTFPYLGFILIYFWVPGVLLSSTQTNNDQLSLAYPPHLFQYCLQGMFHLVYCIIQPSGLFGIYWRLLPKKHKQNISNKSIKLKLYASHWNKFIWGIAISCFKSKNTKYTSTKYPRQYCGQYRSLLPVKNPCN